MESTTPQEPTAETGVIIVDHGSRRSESNEMLLEIVITFRQATQYAIVEPAHMELAEPSIATAFARCVDRGATFIIVHPYFLLPGRHWDEDIPALAAKAAERHPGVSYLVTAPLGAHPLMAQMITQRIEDCLRHSRGEAADCDLCQGTDKCRIRSVGP
jgi:sirohydrochlorin ferrochelatase